MSPTKKMLAAVAAGALVVAACGSSDDDAGSGDDTAATEAPAETEAPADADEPESADTEAPADSDEPADTEAPAEGDEPADTEAPADSGGDAYVLDTSDCDDDATAQIEGPLKIGSSVPLSGGPAVLFAPQADGQRAYIDYYNSEFGGINGEPIELITKDDQYTADLTVGNVDELLFDDEVHVLSNLVGTPNNLAVRDDLNDQCIPQLWLSSGATDWGEINEYPWTTGLLIAYPIESRVWAEYAAAEGAETAALFYVNNEFGQSYADAFKEDAADVGLEIVAEEVIDAAESGAPSAQMTNLVAANPDTILAVPLGAQCIAFKTELGNAKAANPDFDPLVYETGTCVSALFWKSVTNGGADGAHTSINVINVNDPTAADDPKVVNYLAAFEASGSEGDPSDAVFQAGWFGMELTVQNAVTAFESGDYSRAGIMTAARNIDTTVDLLRDGVTLTMNANDGYISEGAQILQWSDADQGFSDVGEITNLEGSLGVAG